MTVHHNAKLSLEQVRRIIGLRRAGAIEPEIAEATGVSGGTVSDIISGATWLHVTGGKVSRGQRLRGPYAPALIRFFDQVDLAGRDACWPWLGLTNNKGYGQFSAGGEKVIAHRWILREVTGTRAPCACHHCDNPPCVNPRHLFWGTHQDNADDRVQKGRSSVMPGVDNPMAKLTDADVMAIREQAAQGGQTYEEIGAPYGVGGSNVSVIVRGAHWRHLPLVPRRGKRSYKLSRDDMAALKRRYAAGEMQKHLAAEFGVTRPVVSRVCGGYYD